MLDRNQFDFIMCVWEESADIVIHIWYLYIDFEIGLVTLQKLHNGLTGIFYIHKIME